jgi:hypothetical protein
VLFLAGERPYVGRSVGAQQLLYGSDRPIVEPGEFSMPDRLDWDPIADATRRALGATLGAGAQ